MSTLTNARGGKIDTRVKILFADGSEYTIDNKKNLISSLKLDEELSAETNCPVGVISSRILDIKISSTDKSLIPDNEKSIHYGLMNSTAKIELYITEAGTEQLFGRYFVDEWSANITNNSPNQVEISATDIMGRLCKMEVPEVEFKNLHKTKDYVIALFTALNEKLDEADRVVINENNIDFGSFPNIIYTNLDMESIGNVLNQISQSTLTNIYINRQGVLMTDSCYDDTKREAKYTLNIMTQAKLKGMYNSFDGVTCVYTKVKPEEIVQVASLKDVDLFNDGEENKIENIKFNKSVYKLNRIEVKPYDVSTIAYVSRIGYSKDKLNLYISSNANTKASIKVYGQAMTKTEQVYEVGGKNKLEMKVSLIEEDYVDKYAELLYKLMTIKNNGLVLKSYLNSNVKLGDMIYVDASGALEIAGYYKVIGINWDFYAYASCSLTLLKTFSVDYNVDSVLVGQILKLYKRLLGITVHINMNDITNNENNSCEKTLGSLLDRLR